MKSKSQAASTLLTRNKVSEVTAEDGRQTGDYLDVVKAFARLSYESVYLIDYSRMAFEYVSENPLFLCGHTAQEVQAMGYDFYFRNVPPADLELLNLINAAGFDFYDRLPDAEKKQYSIAYDFHLQGPDGKKTLINHRLTPLFLTSTGKLWKAMCLVSLSPHRQAGNIVIQRQGSDEYWKLDTDSGTWQKAQKPRLSQRETEVLRLYAQGLTISQIAEKMCVVPDTVKYYRRRIFENFGVSSIVEALSYAVNNKIL